MSGLVLRDLSCARVRANPHYRFASFESLSEAQRSSVGQGAGSTTFAGVLADTAAGALNIKAISPGTATLFEQLRTPLRVPKVLAEFAPHERDTILAGLVLDGVLEIACDDGFVSQCRAYRAIVLHDDDLVGTSKLAVASIAAVKHGQRLAMRDPEMLAARLYFYQRLPVTASWAALWPDSSTVMEFLGVARGGPFRRDLHSQFAWSSPGSRPGEVQWLYAHRRHRPARPRDANGCKLYVSPAPEHIRQAFAEVVALLPASGASSFKIGPNAHGLLRPDKLIVYFDRHDDLLAFTEALLPRLARLSAHGVPFTAPIDEAGLLSWGIDPPRPETKVGSYVDDSWRIWICNRLALALIAAMDDVEMEPWRYALTKLWLSGVDTQTWTRRPTSSLDPAQLLGAHA